MTLATVILNVIGLAFINEKVIAITQYLRRRHRFLLAFAPIMGLCTAWMSWGP